MKKINGIISLFLLCGIIIALTLPTSVSAQKSQVTVSNPILPGFHPDPSICRVGDDYFLCCSSFTWFPGLPIYHSRDLAHWELIGHAIDRPGMVTLDGVKDKDGVWAPTLRWHDGLFYLFCNVSNGGNFYMTATDPRGPWSNPVFIKGMEGGIDPDIFWDTDGRSYVLSNTGKFPGRKYSSSTAIYLQEIDLQSGTLKGERTIISTGHALNAKFSEGPHLYRVGKRYCLLLAEGGTDFNHAVSIHWSDKLTGPYLPQMVNPVLTHRHLGHDAPTQSVGHADLVQTPQGRWYAVCLGKRMVEGRAFTRETFLCPVELQDGEFIFNPGVGPLQGEFTIDSHTSNIEPEVCRLKPNWYYERIPHTRFDTWQGDSVLTLQLMPEMLDSLVSPALVLYKTSPLGFEATVNLSFQAKRQNEQAGLVLHRNTEAYIALLKTAGQLQVIVKDKGQKNIVATIPYTDKNVNLRFTAQGMQATMEYHRGDGHWQQAATVSLQPLTEDNKLNRFNGLGIGMYASSNGKKSKAKAIFSELYYKPIK